MTNLKLSKEPRTAEELAEFKAEKSRQHYKNQTLINLVMALGASLLALLFLILIVYRPSGSLIPPVDYEAVAKASKSGYSELIAVPELPEGWSLNAAGVRTGADDKQLYWYLGFVTPDKGSGQQFIAMSQRIEAEESWPIRVMESTLPTGEIVYDSVSWLEFDRRTSDKASGNHGYGIALVKGSNTVVLHGTGTPEEFELLAKQLNQLVVQVGE